MGKESSSTQASHQEELTRLEIKEIKVSPTGRLRRAVLREDGMSAFPGFHLACEFDIRRALENPETHLVGLTKDQLPEVPEPEKSQYHRSRMAYLRGW